jgi:predicted nucleic acid-binding protein
MADQPEPLDVCTDACVLINLAHVSRLDLLGQIQDMIFHAPQEVLNEVSEPGQMRKVEEALESGVLRRLKIVDVEELEAVAEYVEQFGKGESACLAVAIHRHWVVATDETKDRRLNAGKNGIGRHTLSGFGGHGMRCYRCSRASGKGRC